MVMLTDPTNVGNQPGYGPLRSGGVSIEGVNGEADLPSTPSPAAKAQKQALQLVRDLWGGTEKVRERGELYLPAGAGEDPNDYAARLKRSAFFNAFRRTVEGLAGLAFRRDPVLNDDVPQEIQAHWENIDNAGTHGDVFLHSLFVDGEAAGHSAILVEFPKTDGQQNAAVEMAGEVRPYWLPIMKDNILSWRSTTVNGRLVLTQLVLRECSMVPDGRFGEKEQERYRVFHRDDSGVWFELLEIAEDKKSVVQVDIGRYPTQDEIPVAEVVTSGRKSLFESDPPLIDLAWLNVAHYQMWSDYNWSIYKTCVPVLFGAGFGHSDGEVKIGANTAMLLPEAGATLQYVAHSGGALQDVKAALDDLKNDMGTLGLAMLAPQKRSAETAEAKRLDKATSDSALAVSVRGLQDATERALGFHARYMGLDTGGSVELNRDFEGLLMDAPVMTAFATLVNAGFPPRAVLKQLQQGGRIAPDEDLDVLEMEWMAGVAAREAAREAMAAGFGQGQEDPQDQDRAA